MINIYEAVESNKRKSTLIVVAFLLFFTVALYFIGQSLSYYMGYEAGGVGIVGLALIISGLISFGSYYFSDRIILSISNARPADKIKDFELFTVCENISMAVGIPMPKIYLIEDSAPNAFATGRNLENSVVCVTRGLVDKLTRTELEGVVAHEISHIRNYDMLLMSVVSVLVGSIALISDWFLRMRWHRERGKDNNSEQAGAVLFFIGIIFAFISPLIANLIKLAISRRREFLADAGSVSITKQPSGLIKALEIISSDTEALEIANKATAHLFIDDPFRGKKDRRSISMLAGLFNTHPPINERIKLLKTML